MISEKINTADFLSWFIENYPKSVDEKYYQPQIKNMN